MKPHLLFGAALALALGAGLAAPLLIAQPPVASPQPAAAPKELIHEPLVGGVYDEMIMAEATLPPNASVPWHIHEDAHEIAYVLEGAIRLEFDNGREHVVEAGEGFHIDANLVHRGEAEASGAKVLVVRLKPKDAPIMRMVPHTEPHTD
jgi:quercetin dioxygenase-like cupin family protein